MSGGGTGNNVLSGLSVSSYLNYELQITVLSIDGSTTGVGDLDVGALNGGNGIEYMYRPNLISLGYDEEYGVNAPSVLASTTISPISTTSLAGFSVWPWPEGS